MKYKLNMFNKIYNIEIIELIINKENYLNELLTKIYILMMLL